MERTTPSPKMDRSMLAPMDGSESRLFLAVTFFILADAVSTLAFYLTRTGVERNPVRRPSSMGAVASRLELIFLSIERHEPPKP